MAVKLEQKIISFEPFAFTYSSARGPTAGLDDGEGSRGIAREPSSYSLRAHQPSSLVKILEPLHSSRFSGRIAVAGASNSAPPYSGGEN